MQVQNIPTDLLRTLIAVVVLIIRLIQGRPIA